MRPLAAVAVGDVIQITACCFASDVKPYDAKRQRAALASEQLSRIIRTCGSLLTSVCALTLALTFIRSHLFVCLQVYAALNIFFGMASIGLLTVVAIDRYLTICRPDIGNRSLHTSTPTPVYFYTRVHVLCTCEMYTDGNTDSIL